MGQIKQNQHKIKKLKRSIKIKDTQISKYILPKIGDIGIMAMKSFTLTWLQAETLRKIILKNLSKKGILLHKIHVSYPVTARPIGTRMGKGKGSIQDWAMPVKKGHILFEIKNIKEEIAFNALRLASLKLKIPMKIINKNKL